MSKKTKKIYSGQRRSIIMDKKTNLSLEEGHQWPSWLLVFLWLLFNIQYIGEPVQEHIRCKNRWWVLSDSKHNTIELFIVYQGLQGQIWKLFQLNWEHFWSPKLLSHQIWTMWPLCKIEFTSLLPSLSNNICCSCRQNRWREAQLCHSSFFVPISPFSPASPSSSLPVVISLYTY